MQLKHEAPYKARSRSIQCAKIGDPQHGYLSVISSQEIPFVIGRVYWITQVPIMMQRGGHAHKKVHQALFAVHGTLHIAAKTTAGVRQTFVLDKPDAGLYLPPMTWIEIVFSQPETVLLSVCSGQYDPEEYVRDYQQFCMHT